MRNQIFLFLMAMLLMSFAPASAQQETLKPEVMETVELMSILSRTAGYQEYNMDMGGQYTQDIEAWFAPFKDHPIIEYYQGLRHSYGIGYDAPMDIAVALQIDGQRIRLDSDKSDLDSRWAMVDLDDFVTRLNQFYTDTRFHEFYQQHQPFYNEVLAGFEANVMQYFHQDWYPRFYGAESNESFRVFVGFANSGQNYATSRQLPGRAKEYFSILGYWVYPRMGSVIDTENAKKYTAPTLIHEFNHSFVNPLLEIDKNAALLGDIPQRLLEQDFEIMERQAYPEGSIVFNESVVRAATIIYMMDHGYAADEVEDEMMSQLMNGFKWMPELVAALRDYKTHRNKYPTLNDFYPQIAKVLKKYLDDAPKRIDNVLSFKPSTAKSSATASLLEAQTMETVELMGVLSRMAGFEEYNTIENNLYIQDVDKWFEPFKQHPVVEHYQELRQQCHIAYDAPMSLAVRLAVEDGKIVRLQEEAGDTGLDDRWNLVNMDGFLNLLSRFYADTRFHEFYQQHQPFYQETLQAFNREVMPCVNPEWFADFYGGHSGDMQKIVMGFATRDGGAYGSERHLMGHPHETCPVVCYYGSDQMANITEEMRNAIANMITGMFVSPLDLSSGKEDKNVALINEIGARLFDNNPMLAYRYGFSDGQAVMSSSIEKAANIVCLMENGGSVRQVEQELKREMTSGFNWMPEVVTALRDYSSHRNKYKTISNFYPQLAKVMNKYLADEEKRMDKALK